MQAVWRTISRVIPLAGMLAAAAVASGEDRHPLDADWRWTVEGAGVHGFETSIDSGGEVSTTRYFVSGGASRSLAARWRVGAAIGFGEDRYDFSGSSGFGALDPWDTAREFRLSLPVSYFAEGDWSFFGIPSVRFNAESGASLSDGTHGGLLAGAAYRVNERLTIGPGFGAFSEIEDDPSFFPILLVDWQITDSLSLETGRGLAASRGPGLQLNWQHSPRWTFAVGGRYEKIRFRLDDEDVAPDGVGELEAVPVYLQARYAMSPATTIGLVGGAELGGDLRLENSSGRVVESTGLSTVPFLGITFRTEL